MKILITGGAGFIGSNFVRYVLQVRPDWEIVNLDKLTYAGNLDNLRDVEGHPFYSFVRGDVADAALVNSLFDEYRFDMVAHLAAESHVDRSIADSSLFVETNVKGTQVLLEASRRYGVSKFLQVSTDEVYGSLSQGDPPFTEETPVRPNNPYSASKASADLIAMAYYRTYGLPVVISRCSNNYGPCQHPEKFIPTIILNALAGKEIPVYGDGMNVRDWIYVSDHCRALDLILTRGRIGEVYNVGASEERTNLEITRRILELLGAPRDLIRFVKDRPGHDKRYSMDAGRVRGELGWEPEMSLEEGLLRTVEWYRGHREWWKNILDEGQTSQ